MPRVMMIGLDAGNLDFIKEYGTALPNLRRLYETGVTQRLWSRSGELFPASVWPTFYTGTEPGHHGVYFPLQWDCESMSLRPMVDMLYCEPFWVELERRGHRVVVFDVPFTWRSRLRRGVEITGWATHDEVHGFSVWPVELEAEIKRRFGGRSIGPEIRIRKSRGELERIRDDVVRSAARKGALATWLLGRADWDFFITVFGETHRAGHLFWPTADDEKVDDLIPEGALLTCYQAVDRAIGEMLGRAADRETTVVLFSVHGMGENHSQEQFTRPIMDRINERFRRQIATEIVSKTLRRPAIMRALRNYLPARLQHAVGRAVPAAWRDAVVNRALTAGYDWARTPGLSILASVNGFVRFNLRGRESAGMLEPGSELHRKYVQLVAEGFRSCRIASSGEALVNEVTLTEEEFGGERSAYLPDAVVSWSNHRPASRVESEMLGSVRGEPSAGRTGNHRPEGFAIVVEPGRPRGAQNAQGEIVDLASMISRLLNCAA